VTVGLLREPEALRSCTAEAHRRGRTVGIVPTMGALHEGHLSLVRRAVAECDEVVVTVFVNPLQFGAGEDLVRYPRRVDTDAALATAAGAGWIFAPSEDAMYPAGFQTSVRVGALAAHWEGESRPGHFDGVATVVVKLLALAQPERAYFGEKDFQQLQVVRRAVADLGLGTEIVPCSTVREPDGLALSSRNAYLGGAAREAARSLWRALEAGEAAIEAGVRDPTLVGRSMRRELERDPLVQVDYAVAVDPATLEVPEQLGGPVRLLVAARVDGTRLIDNLGCWASPLGTTGRGDTGPVAAAVAVTGAAGGEGLRRDGRRADGRAQG